MKNERFVVEIFAHRFGPYFLLACSEKGLRAVMLGTDKSSLLEEFRARFGEPSSADQSEQLQRAKKAFLMHLAMPEVPFDFPLDVRGTPFQIRVWSALAQISPGTTLSYSELAMRLNMANGFRAVANACGANPLAVVIPCHRVMGKNGALTGYRYGLEAKRHLLDQEQALA